MKHKIFSLIVLFLSASVAVTAQQKIQVSGKVSDKAGLPLEGVALVETGSATNGVMTDSLGRYTISVPDQTILEISCLGYKTVMEHVNGRKKIDVTLSDDNELLEATVVIGYGTSKKGDLTGTVSVVNMNEISTAPVTSVAQALQGKIAGAEFASGSGEVGESAEIRIRGSRSITAGNKPLIVVDGVPDAVEDLNEINPADIVNISVLKDISSTAIYGSRGANGVILVTTQDDRKGDGTFAIRFKSTLSYAHLAGSIDILNAEEYARWRNMAAAAFASYNPDKPPYNPDDYKGKGTDWIDVLSQDVFAQDYYLSTFRKVGGTSFSITLGYNNTPGVVICSGMQRFTGRVNINSALTKKLHLNFKMTYTHTDRDRASATITGTSSTAAIFLSPILKPTDTWNRYGDQESSGGTAFNSPYLVAKNTANDSKNNYFMASPTLKYDINRRMNVKLRLAVTDTRTETGYYSPSYMPVAKINMTGGTAKVNDNRLTKYIGELTWEYKRKIKAHDFGILAGFTGEHWDRKFTGLSGSGYTNDSLSYKNLLGLVHPDNFSATSYVQYQNKLSALGRFDYNYRRRYYLTLTLRGDGASNFAQNRKWGFFPAVALRWSIMNEKWFNNTPWLDDLSIRLSAGRSGNDAISPYMSLATFTSGYTNWIFGDDKLLAYTSSKLANSNLTWETTDSYNLGFSFAGWSSRVIFEADAYVSNTNDLLLSMRNTQTTGYNTYYANAGSTRNIGQEFTLTTRNVVTKMFEWNSVLTLAHNSQIVTSVGSESEVVPTYSNPRTTSPQYIYGYKKGYPVNAIWGYKYEGTWHSDADIAYNEITRAYISSIKTGANGTGLGRPKYADINHDGILDENDVVYLGSSDPVIYGGFQNNFLIGKGLSVGVYFTYSLGGYIYNLSELYSMSGSASPNKLKPMLGAWTADNPTSNICKAGFDDTLASSKSVYDASWFRLKSVSINYNVPLPKKVKKVLKELSFGLSGDNLWLWKKYPGFDPDVNTSSSVFRLDNGSFPRSRTYAFNLQVKF